MDAMADARNYSNERKPLTYNRYRRVITISFSPATAAAILRSAAWRANAGNNRRV
jgi:hypothetical protein